MNSQSLGYALILNVVFRNVILYSRKYGLQVSGVVRRYYMESSNFTKIILAIYCAKFRTLMKSHKLRFELIVIPIWSCLIKRKNKCNLTNMHANWYLVHMSTSHHNKINQDYGSPKWFHVDRRILIFNEVNPVSTEIPYTFNTVK